MNCSLRKRLMSYNIYSHCELLRALICSQTWKLFRALHEPLRGLGLFANSGHHCLPTFTSSHHDPPNTKTPITITNHHHQFPNVVRGLLTALAFLRPVVRGLLTALALFTQVTSHIFEQLSRQNDINYEASEAETYRYIY